MRSRASSQTFRGSRRLKVVSVAIGITASVTVCAMVLGWSGPSIDLHVFLLAGREFVGGGELYGPGFGSELAVPLPYTYPPLLAAISSTVAWMPWSPVGWLWVAANIGLLLWCTRRAYGSFVEGSAADPYDSAMRILIWHGWLLEGSGSNVATAKVCEVFRASGHDVVLLCQEPHPERYAWIDAFGSIGAGGPGELTQRRDASRASGRCIVLRPSIGTIVPVFVVDRYEGFDEVKRFVDLTTHELDSYLHANVEAVKAAVAWHGSGVSIFGHVVPGAAIARRALGPGRYLVKVHGSDLEYAVRHQARYQSLAREGLSAAQAVVGPGREVLERTASFVPEVRGLAHVVPPGVDVTSFRPRPRADALLEAAALLERDPDTVRGRPTSLDDEVARALSGRDRDTLDALATGYEQDVPDRDAAARLRKLAHGEQPIIGYLGKLIPQKGAELMLASHRIMRRSSTALVVGFGSYREWLAALDIALRTGDRAALEWLARAGEMPVAISSSTAITDERRDVVFTGRLDHRYAPAALAAMDVQIVPSILQEAFGMVAAEGAAAGALIMVARHSGLAEVAGALEAEVDRPGLFSFEPGDRAVHRLAEGVDSLLSLPVEERDELRAALSTFVRREWTWDRTAARLLKAAGAG